MYGNYTRTERNDEVARAIVASIMERAITRVHQEAISALISAILSSLPFTTQRTLSMGEIAYLCHHAQQPIGSVRFHGHPPLDPKARPVYAQGNDHSSMGLNCSSEQSHSNTPPCEWPQPSGKSQRANSSEPSHGHPPPSSSVPPCASSPVLPSLSPSQEQAGSASSDPAPILQTWLPHWKQQRSSFKITPTLHPHVSSTCRKSPRKKARFKGHYPLA